MVDWWIFECPLVQLPEGRHVWCIQTNRRWRPQPLQWPILAYSTQLYGMWFWHVLTTEKQSKTAKVSWFISSFLLCSDCHRRPCTWSNGSVPISTRYGAKQWSHSKNSNGSFRILKERWKLEATQVNQSCPRVEKCWKRWAQALCHPGTSQSRLSKGAGHRTF